MEIGRLEFYATKPDVKGKFYGKIHPYNQALRDSIDGGLVFFHESRIPRTSALRTDQSLQGYRYKTRQRGRTVFADPVYVAFDMPRSQTSRRGDDTATVMLLEEADPDELPDLASVEGAGAKVALISAFPSVYTLSRSGRDIVESGQAALLKACWDGSTDDERVAFVRSLDPAVLEKALVHLIGIDRQESLSLASPRRTKLALAARPDAALIPGVAEKLTPGMWVDELLAIMRDPDRRSVLVSSAQPAFRAYALTKYAEAGGSLEGSLADDFVAAIRGSVGAGIATECLKAVLAVQPRLALRGDVSAMLTPEMWVDELLPAMGDPEERHAFLAATRPEFHAHAVYRFVGAGGLLDGDDATGFANAVRGCADKDLADESLRSVLGKQPRLALDGDITAMLTPGMWDEGFLGLMERPEDLHALLSQSKRPFRVYATAKYVEAGGRLDDADSAGFATAVYECEDTSMAAKCLSTVLDRQPRIALARNIASILTPRMWVDGLLDLMGSQDDRRSLLAHARPTFHMYATARYVEAGGRLSEADVTGLEAAVRECEDADLAAECLSAILARQPRVALAGDVASVLTPRMWVDELLGLMKTPQGQMALLTPCNPDFRSHAVRKLIEADIDLGIGILSLCPLRSYTNLLDQVKWSSEDAAYAEAVGRWLGEARLCDADGRRLVVSAAERMHAAGELLSPVMWAHLPAEVQVRLCIYWSNHYTDLDDCAVRGGITKTCIDAYRDSWRGYDQASKAALLLLALPLSKNPEKAFLDANDALIGEIVRQFNDCDAEALRSFALGDGLQALLQRCASYPYAGEMAVRGFCDGRAWNKDDGTMGVWCHSGTDRPEGGRRECKSQPLPIIAPDGWRGLRSSPEDQFMADLLANVNGEVGGVNVGPWIEPGKMGFSMSLVEYAYRVSGYVNKLAAALPHMVCRGCGTRLRLNYKYPREGLYGRSLDLPALSGPAISGTVCSCPNAGTGGKHDEDIYIHYCLNCHRVIDSRECRMRDVKADGSPGMYLCMYCGASGDFKAGTVCPSCKNTDLNRLRYFRGSMREERRCDQGRPPYGGILIACKKCKYDAREFHSEFE